MPSRWFRPVRDQGLLALVVCVAAIGGAVAIVHGAAHAATDRAKVLPPCFPDAPTNGTRPSVSGNTVWGSTLSTTDGTWSVTCGGPVVITGRQWKDNGSPISGATGSAYVTLQSQVGHAISSSITACNNADQSMCTTVDSSNSITVTNPPNRPPNTPSEDQVPASSSAIDGKAGDSFTYKFSDPDGNSGHITYSIFNNGTLIQTLTGPTVASGADSSVFLPSALTSGSGYSWTAVATDSGGLSSSPSISHGFAVDQDPATPTVVTPLSGTTVPTTAPVLTASSGDPEGELLGYQFTLWTGASCTGTQVFQSGFQPGTPTLTVPSNLFSDGGTYYWCVQSRDYVARSEGNDLSPLSSAANVHIALPKLGDRKEWPMWRGDGVAVNEATGNLVLPVPGPSFPTAAGSLGASFVYNLLDTRPTALAVTANSGSWTFADDSGAPARLIDHSIFSAAAGGFDAVERVEADGSSDWYGHVAGSDAYQSEPGDLAVLTRTGTGSSTSFLLSDPNGATFQYGAPDANGIATLTQAQVFRANGQAKLVYIFASGHVQSITAQGKDSGGAFQTLGALTFNWSCTAALLCVTGPDGKTWQYIGSAGATGNLTRVNDGTRDVLQIGYDASNRPNSIKNANDIDPTHADSAYLTGHAIGITYSGLGIGQVATVSDSVRNRLYTPTTTLRRWTFVYSSGPCSGASLHSPTATHPQFAQPALAGCTTIKTPNQDGQALPQVARVFYDNLGHPLEVDNPLETTSTLKSFNLYAFDKNDRLEWTEDGLGNPTDYSYDTFDQSLQSTTGPDPDGSGPIARPVTTYRYDETQVGSASTAGPTLQGLQASYYPVSDLTGYPAKQQNDANIDSAANWGAGGPPALGGQSTNFSVRWTGAINVTAGTYVFATTADGGTRVFVDGAEIVNDWTGQTTTAPYCAPAITLTVGRHRIVVDYHETTGTTSVKLQSGATCQTLTTVASSTLVPEWLNRTSTVAPPNSTGGNATVSFAHFASQATHEPDYTLATAGATSLVTSLEYDPFGRLINKTLPKGNVGRLQANGTLTGTADTTYQTTYSYYTAGQVVAEPSTCGVVSANQMGLLQNAMVHGLTAKTFYYDSAGRMDAQTNAAGATCRSFDGEGNLTSDMAPGEALSSTYSYDPSGNLLSATNAAGTDSYRYNEANQLIDKIDTFGAERENVYDADSNLVTRRIATSSLQTAPSIYSTSFVYDAADEETSLTDPATRVWSFFYDSNGRLKATTYPNSTFSWNDYFASGWLQARYNRHGTFSTLPASAPADSNALADYTYTYEPNGQRASETRSGGSLTTATTTYTYDSLSRLDSATFGDGSARRYCYDLDSNRTTTFFALSGGAPTCGGASPETTLTYTPTTNAGVDELTSQAIHNQAHTFDYNSDGDTTRSGINTLTWDGRDRNTGGVLRGTQLTYTYDAAGDLVQRVGTVRYSGQVLQVSPAVYWRLEDPTGAVTAFDSSDNSLPGTYGGGVTNGQTGPVTTETDKSVLFNGTTGTVSRPVVTNLTAGVAIEAWFYWSGGGTNQQIVAYNGTPGTNGYGIAISNGSCGSGSTIELILGGVSCAAISGGTAAINTWYHVVASRSAAGTWTLYVNAVSQGTSAVAPLAPTGSTSVSPASFPFTGRVDEFALFNSGLGAPIVTSQYQRATATTSSTTRFLIDDLLETDGTTTITAAVTDGPGGYLARYAGAPVTASSVNFLYYNGHGDLASQANTSGSRLATYLYDPFGGTAQSTLPGNGMTPRFVGAWGKQLDSASALITMGARPYDPSLGRFLSVDPIDGGSLNNYDYAAQDPINAYDLPGTNKEFGGLAEGGGYGTGDTGYHDPPATEEEISNFETVTRTEALKDDSVPVGRGGFRFQRPGADWRTDLHDLTQGEVENSRTEPTLRGYIREYQLKGGGSVTFRPYSKSYGGVPVIEVRDPSGNLIAKFYYTP